MLAEDKIKTEIKMRTAGQKARIACSRLIAAFISIIILILGWAAIFAGTYYEGEMGAWLEE